MKILLVLNKTLGREGKQELDTGLYYVYEPLVALGHEVYFYDTVAPRESNFNLVSSGFKPDLVFCCMTGNPYITPFEPWENLLRLTRQEGVTTFNWFCDDTWRFDDFSSKACWYFDYCSTPEPTHISKYRNIGYNNVVVGNWHVNGDYYPPTEKDIDLSFVGGMTPSRQEFFAKSKIPITRAGGLDIEQLFNFYCRSKIGINLSVNANDPEKKTQMKLRVFELAAANCTVLTEYHPGIEEFFDIEKEIVVFKGVEEFEKKVAYLQANPETAKKIAAKGHSRFLKDHESKIRLKKLLESITSEA